MLRSALAFSQFLSKDIIFSNGPKVSGKELIFEKEEDVYSPDISKTIIEKGITTIVYNIPSQNLFEGLKSYIKSVSNLVIEQFSDSELDLSSYQLYNLKSITIPETITTIGSACFRNWAITSIDLKNVNSVQYAAFANCIYLETIKAPLLTSIPSGFASGCYSLSSLTTGSITSIDYSAFMNCYKLTSIDLTGVTTISDSAFANSGIESITIPATCTKILNYAFQSSSLSKITFDSGITSMQIGTYAFSNTYISSITFPSSLTFSDYTVAYCSKLKEIVLPDDLTSIPPYFAYMCTNLNSVEAKGATVIQKRAFQFCINLETVKFSTVTAFQEYCFSYCSKLRMQFDETVPVTFEEHSFEFCDLLSFDSVPSTWSFSGSYNFLGCNGLTSLKIAKSPALVLSKAVVD